jgi:pimeloyl-ACP methyl ester carboxylesterase
MDTSPGPVPGLDPDLVDFAAGIALAEGKDVLKPMLDAAATLETPAYVRLLAERPGFEEFELRKWDALSGVMWATMAREMAHQPDQLALLAGVLCPTLVIVGEEDASFVDPSRDMAATIPGAELVVVPDAGHSPQFENPFPWFEAVDGFLLGIERAPAA